MPKYYRVNLKDKENNIIYPNISDNWEFDNNGNVILKNCDILSLEKVNKYVTTGHKEVNNTFDLDESFMGSINRKNISAINYGLINISYKNNADYRMGITFLTTLGINLDNQIQYWHYKNDERGKVFTIANLEQEQTVSGIKIHTNHLYLNGQITEGGTISNTAKLFFGPKDNPYFCIRNSTGALVISNSATSNDTSITYNPTQAIFAPTIDRTMNLGSDSYHWKSLYSDFIDTKEILLNRQKGSGCGRISFYSKNYDTWYLYMTSAEQETSGPNNRKPSTYGNVTTWALRNFIEKVGGYGWIWESGTDKSYGTDLTITPMMALSSYDGSLYVRGLINGCATSTGDGSLKVYAGHSNEINFGGTGGQTTIHFGYRTMDGRGTITDYLFRGGSSAYANITGKGITASGGLLYSTNHSNTVTIGSQNSSYCHIYNSANIPFYFNKVVYVNNGYYAVGSANSSVHNLYILALSTWNSNYSSYVAGTVGFCY